MAHAAVGDGVADSTRRVAGKTGGTVAVSAALVSVADSIVTDLGIGKFVPCDILFLEYEAGPPPDNSD